MNNKNDDNIQVNFLENNSIDSIDDDFQTSGKYLEFNSDTNRIEAINPKVNLAKKNTKISSNNDEDVENEIINNNHEKKLQIILIYNYLFLKIINILKKVGMKISLINMIPIIVL